MLLSQTIHTSGSELGVRGNAVAVTAPVTLNDAGNRSYSGEYVQVLLYSSTSRVFTNTRDPEIHASLRPSDGKSFQNGQPWRLTLLNGADALGRDERESVFAHIESTGPPFPRPDDPAFGDIVQSQSNASGMPVPVLPQLPDGYDFSVTPGNQVWEDTVIEAPAKVPKNGGSSSIIGIVVGAVFALVVLSVAVCLIVLRRRRRQSSNPRGKIDEQVGVFQLCAILCGMLIINPFYHMRCND